MQRPVQSDTTLEELNQLIWEHLEARDWTGNKPRGLATSISLEAAELLEHYQWSDEAVGTKEELGEELADILIYAIQFAQVNNIDIADSIRKKLEKAAKKYPADQFKGKGRADRRAAWLEAKFNHHKEGL